MWASCLALVRWTSFRLGSRVPVVWKRWLVGSCSQQAIVKEFIGALVEAFPHRRRPRVLVVGEGVVRRVVPMLRRRVWHCQAARVAVPQLRGAQRDDVAWWGL